MCSSMRGWPRKSATGSTTHSGKVNPVERNSLFIQLSSLSHRHSQKRDHTIGSFAFNSRRGRLRFFLFLRFTSNVPFSFAFLSLPLSFCPFRRLRLKSTLRVYPIGSFLVYRVVLQNEFRYDFRIGLREISAGMVITVLKAIMHVNTVNTVPAEISRGPFRKTYRNSFCKTSLISMVIFVSLEICIVTRLVIAYNRHAPKENIPSAVEHVRQLRESREGSVVDQHKSRRKQLSRVNTKAGIHSTAASRHVDWYQ